jgi:hypothetical protein
VTKAAVAHLPQRVDCAAIGSNLAVLTYSHQFAHGLVKSPTCIKRRNPATRGGREPGFRRADPVAECDLAEVFATGFDLPAN